MSKFEKKIRNRIKYRISSIIVLLPLAIYTLIKYIGSDVIVGGTPVLDFIGGFFNGVRGAIVFGFIIYQVIRMVYDIEALKDKEKLKNIEIEENDERQILINELSSKVAYNISLFIIMIACLISGIFNPMVSVTLLFVWVVIVLVRFFTNVYYEKRI